VGRVQARRQVDELLGVRAHLAAHVKAAETVLQGQLRPGLQHHRHGDGVERHLGAVEVVRIQQITVTGGAQGELGGPAGQAEAGGHLGGDDQGLRLVGERRMQRLGHDGAAPGASARWRRD
jgi:hypothetical protein